MLYVEKMFGKDQKAEKFKVFREEIQVVRLSEAGRQSLPCGSLEEMGIILLLTRLVQKYTPDSNTGR